MSKPTKEKDCIRLMAEILAGTQVPRSLGSILGEAIKPWDELRAKLGGVGWLAADDFEVGLRKFITDKEGDNEPR